MAVLTEVALVSMLLHIPKNLLILWDTSPLGMLVELQKFLSSFVAKGVAMLADPDKVVARPGMPHMDPIIIHATTILSGLHVV